MGGWTGGRHNLALPPKSHETGKPTKCGVQVEGERAINHVYCHGSLGGVETQHWASGGGTAQGVVSYMARSLCCGTASRTGFNVGSMAFLHGDISLWGDGRA